MKSKSAHQFLPSNWTASKISLRYRIREDTHLSTDKAGLVSLFKWPKRFTFDSCPPALDRLLKSLRDSWVSFDAQFDDLTKLEKVRNETYLGQLLSSGWLDIEISCRAKRVLILRPRRAVPATPSEPLPPLRVSKFAIAYQEEDATKVELPHSWTDIEIIDPSVLVTIWGSRDEPKVADDDLSSILYWTKALVRDEPEAFVNQQWSAHELWFHERSRRYARSSNFGGTFWAKSKFPPLPSVAPHVPKEIVPFNSLDVDSVESLTLHEALESRSSNRVHDNKHPMTKAELGSFLYRTARTRTTQTVAGIEYVSRPYPSGGSVYEIDLYVAAQNIDGLAPGFYYYHPIKHGLGKLADSESSDVAALVQQAQHSSAVDSQPQAVLFFSAQVGRIFWKYQEMGYSLTLKHVGVLMQTMCLVATDMGLASCAIGSGDSDLFAVATGLDPMENTSVGEFLLGSAS